MNPQSPSSTMDDPLSCQRPKAHVIRHKMAANQHKQEGAKKNYLTMVYISIHNKTLLIYYMIKMLNE
jgi:hypothetical protein